MDATRPPLTGGDADDEEDKEDRRTEAGGEQAGQRANHNQSRNHKKDDIGDDNRSHVLETPHPPRIQNVTVARRSSKA
ncbi:hypothetical protein XFLAVUS301_14840 [Xanthobacter flavus]|uniref:Uncharacterized protein n=1 Tax=Xanthobacter flavus TaxID=281 RepID=A0A9W6FJ41_XANFL|nr:hypothetical protein XFLAVUS301_14840 [Xanthobacter flavus]